MTIAVILPAAGQSRRFTEAGGKGQGKLSVEIGRKPILQRAVELFANHKRVKQIIIAADPDHLDTFRFRWGDTLGILGATIVAGGRAERWETVRNALSAVEEGITHVAVHDAARPVTDPQMIERVFEAGRYYSAVIPALAIHETIKRVQDKAQTTSEGDPLDAILGSAGKKTVEARPVLQTLSREGLWTAQTPQLFEIGLLKRAYEQIGKGIDASAITDDAGLIEALGEPVHVVEGDRLNVKITVPLDVTFAEAVLAVRTGKAGGDVIGPKRKHATWAQMADDV